MSSAHPAPSHQSRRQRETTAQYGAVTAPETRMKTIPTALIAPLFNPATFAARGQVDALLSEVRRDYPLAQAEVPGYDPRDDLATLLTNAEVDGVAMEHSRAISYFAILATADCTLAGQQIRQGDRLYLSYPSGNRDDAELERPFSFRLDHARNRHVGFGYGGHVCLGQHLARREMCALWETLLPALVSVEMAGPGQLIASEFVSRPKSVPIRYRLA